VVIVFNQLAAASAIKGQHRLCIQNLFKTRAAKR